MPLRLLPPRSNVLVAEAPAEERDLPLRLVLGDAVLLLDPAHELVA